MKFKFGIVLAVLAVGVFTSSFAHAEGGGQSSSQSASRFFEAQARAVDGASLMAGKTPIRLWGVQPIDGMPAQFSVNVRSALDNALGTAKVRCEMKSRDKSAVVAQCTNSFDQDLGLYMIQRGYAVVDRSAVFGSVFEEPYIQAEKDAQKQGLGVWSREDGGGSEDSGSFMMIVGAVLILCLLGVFSVLTLIIMKGFQKVTDVQTQSMDMMARERVLRDKERAIFATMLDSEIKANKAKIEAYLVVYDEMLKNLKDPEKTPKYKKVGDIVQEQPALERSVFDRNTDKLDILGDRLSSEVIHFYARIKSKPDYINLEPEMPVEDVRDIVEGAYQRAQRLDKISDRLIDLFERGGHGLEEEDEEEPV
ncbi:MAG: thermonuclease family protein [Rhodospirillales bacterium]|nr:thermonuclease family protein [Rhodospirillales bacterium]